MPDTPQVWLNDTQVNPVDATNPFSYYNPTVTQLTNGNIVVVYDDNGGRSADGGPSHWRLYDPVGTVIASGVTDDSAGNPIVVALGDGGFMIADDYATGLTTGSVVEAWRYDADGTFQNYAAIDNRLWAGIGDEPSDNRLQASAANDINTMIVYTAYDGGIYGQLYARIYTPALGLVGPELQIASPGDPFNGPNLVYGNAHIAGVDAVALANGNYAVAYGVSNGLSGSSEVSNVQVVIFNEVGTQIIEQTVIDNGLANTDPSITALEGGGLVVTWTLDGTGGTDSGIRLKVLDGAGSPLTGTINPLTTTTGNQNEPVVAALADGGFVVIWDDDNLSDIKGQRFDAFGNRIGTEFTIDAAGSQTAIEVVGLEDGRFAVTWQESDQIRMEFYDVRDLPTLMDYDGANLQIGTTGNDVMTDVAVGADRIYGNGGNDRVYTSTLIYSDFFDGGTGIDTIDWSGSGEDNAVFDLNAGTATDATGQVETMINFEYLVGTENRDTIYGTNGANDLKGRGGADIIDGRNGNDTIRGQAGNDTIIDGDGIGTATSHDTFYGGTGVDTFISETVLLDDVMFDLDAGVVTNGGTTGDIINGFENITIYSGADVTGTEGDNTIIVVSSSLFDYSNTIYGLGGDDTIESGDGDDIVEAGNGEDTVHAGDGDDAVGDSDGIGVGIGGARDAFYGEGGTDTFISFNDAPDGALFDLAAGHVKYGLVIGDIIDGFENITFFGGANVNGTDGDNVIIAISAGTVLSNTVNGFGGNDTIETGDGDDIVDAGDGGDTVDAGTGNDIVTDADGAGILISLNPFNGSTVVVGRDTFEGGSGVDTLVIEYDTVAGALYDLAAGRMVLDGKIRDIFTGFENITLRGAADANGTTEANVIIVEDAGSLASNTLTGLEGDDVLDGGAGGDVLDGGLGSDTASYANSSAGVNIQLQYNVIEGGDADGDTLISIENLTGSAFSDTLYGNPDANRLEGGDGVDYLKGLNGADELIGGDGDDWLYADNLDTLVEGGDGVDRLIVLSAAAVTNAVGVNSIEIATGNVGADVFDGTGALVGLSLTGLSGNDILIGGDHDDYLYGGYDADQMFGGAGLDRLYIDEFDTLIDGGAGLADRVLVQQLATSTVGVTVDMAASHVEVAYGNLNDDTFDGSSSTDALSLFGRNGQDTLIGGSANDRLYGDENDAATGDILNGGEGNDFLYGGVNGTGGFTEADTFVFDADWGNDRIFDFADNGAEKIDFSSIAGITRRTDLTFTDVTDGSGSYAQVSYTDAAGWTGTIRVYDVAAANLQDNDFVYA